MTESKRTFTWQRRRLFPIICWLFAVSAGALCAQSPAPILVDVPDPLMPDLIDGHDKTPGDGICATDKGKCTLRAAVEENLALSPRPGVKLPAGVYKLTAGPILINKSMYILGEDPLTTQIDANGNRGFDIAAAPTGLTIISLSGLTIFNGRQDFSGGVAGGINITDATLNLTRVHILDCSAGWTAAGILNNGSLHMEKCRINGCRVPIHDGSGAEGRGGGILSSGPLEIFDSEISGNEGTIGGGILNQGPLRLINTTISGNRVSIMGGGLFHTGAGSNSAVISFCTITKNQVRVTPAPKYSIPAPDDINHPGGGGIFNTGSITMASSIVAGNDDLGADKSPDIWSFSANFPGVVDPVTLQQGIEHFDPVFKSARSNVVGIVDPANCNLADPFFTGLPFDQTGTPGNPRVPLLGGLIRNGGATSTHALLAGSPALNQGGGLHDGSVFACPERDQRRVLRPHQDGQAGTEPCDAGAFELSTQTDFIEAEAGQATGNYFKAVSDANASGGFYASVSSDLPGSTLAPNEQQHLDLDVYVENAGNYNLQGWVRAANGDQNSFWVKVDGFPQKGFLWDVVAGGSGFQADMVSDRGAGLEGNPEFDPVNVYLPRGAHTVSIYLREPGAQLDRVRLIPAPQAFIQMQVESSALMTGGFLVANDDQAQSGQYVFTPPGSGDFLAAPDNARKITQTVTVDQAGTYLIRGHVRATFDDQNSFWVKVDGQPGNGFLWDMTETNANYGLDYVSNRGAGDSRNPAQDPVELNLSPGTHTIEVFARESGARLDDIGLELKSSADAHIVSRNKTATSSSNESIDLSAAKAVDANSGTRWSSQSGDNQWIRIDLGRSYNIYRVMLYWDAAYGQDYDIEISDDGSVWSPFYHMLGGTGGSDNLMSQGKGRYVRMKGLKRGTTAGYSLREFEVYGDSLPGNPGGFVCSGACLSAEPAAKNQTKVLNTTAERWYVVDDVVGGWQASETTGREIYVNGVKVLPGQMPLPARVNGKYYFRFTEGTNTWASWSFWN
jgi:hypothetical protein